MNFPPIVILIILWIIMGLASSKKKAQQKAARKAQPGAAKTRTKAPEAEPEPSGPAQPRVEPARPTVMQPTIKVTEHDDSIYQGSLYAETGEGYDPCHDGQLSALSALEREPVSVPAAETPGLQLGWTGNDIVRGFVMSEILTRKKRAS